MEYLRVHEVPALRQPVLVSAFAGWSDAGQAATNALRYLVRKLPAKKFAEIDPEEFYEFTTVRPMTAIVAPGQREIRWPANEFFYWKNAVGSRDLVLFIGIEPNLKWRTYVNSVLSLAGQCGVKMAFSLGALVDAVPHTREPKTTGSGNTIEMRRALGDLGAALSSYQGPTGITSALMEACTRQGISYGSLWGHSPHYIQSIPNPKVGYTLLVRLSQLLDFTVDLREMEAASIAFDEEVRKAIANSPEVIAYIRKLEEAYDAAVRPSSDLPRPEDMVKEMEDFLRRRRRGPGDGGDQAP